MNKANWNLFKQTLDANMTIKDLNNCTKQQLEQEANTWLDTVKNAMNTAIPKSIFKPVYQIKITLKIKQLERAYNIPRNIAERDGWTYNNYREHQRIRNELKEKCMQASNKNCEEKISNIIEKSKDTKAFWNQISLLKGQTNKYTNYLEDKDGQRYYTNKERCNIMGKSRRDIFRITDEEDATFDQLHSQNIRAYLNIHNDRIESYSRSDLNRLNDN